MVAQLEHINVTVRDAGATAQALVNLFGWHIRWQGPAKDGGISVHVGSESSYMALYSPRWELNPEAKRYHHDASLNHIGVVVADIDATEKKVIAAGYTPHSHDNYEPGLRFYFDGPDGVEYEVVSYP